MSLTADLIITRKQARAIIDQLPNDTPETGTFFEALSAILDEEQGADPDDREGITIKVRGTEM